LLTEDKTINHHRCLWPALTGLPLLALLAAACLPGETPTPTPIIPATPAPTGFRAFWVDAFNPGIKSPQEVERLVQDAQAAHLNALVVQVRKRADAYFNQTIEPRSDDLQKLPDYDPLAYLIAKAHAANPPLEVHAWLNAMPIGILTALPTNADHLYFTHGPQAQGEQNWLSQSRTGALISEDNYFLDPGHPAAAQHVVDVVLNLVRHYDVDGIHLDYIRYTGAEWGYNPVSVARYQALSGATGTPDPTDPGWSQWRRDQVTALVRQVYLETIALKPQIKVSAATIAWGAGPTSDAGWLQSRTYTDALQDWPAWLQEGILDMALPMNYDREHDARQKTWYDQWIEWEKNHRADRHLIIGIGVYINDIDNSLAQIRRALAPSSTGQSAQGVCFFSYAQTDARGLRIAKFLQALTVPGEAEADPIFREPAQTPAMPWKTHPTSGYLKGFARYADGRPADGLTVTLAGPVNRTLTVSGTGFYGATRLPPGRYTMTITRAGQPLASAQTTINPGMIAAVDFDKLP